MSKQSSQSFGASAKGYIRSSVETVTSWVDGQTTLTAVFAGAIVIANVLAAKIAAFDVPGYGSAFAPAGFLALGVAFLMSDVLSERYGPRAAHRAVNGTIIAVAVALGLVYASVLMPSAPFSTLGDAYGDVLLSGTAIALASILTMAVSQNLDVAIFHRLKSAGLPKWMRNIGSTAISQFVDTALFIVLGFAVLPRVVEGSVTPLYALPSLIVSQYVLKVIVAALDTPLFYLLTWVGGEE